MSEIELAIESVGVRGDGVAYHDGKPVYVPFAAPGDRVRARLSAAKGETRGELVEVLTAGSRAAPVCAHFGRCGGCALQHLSDGAYAAAKLGWLEGALAQHGFANVDIAPLQRLAPGTRRRACLALARDGEAVAGFHGRMSHAIVDMRECHVLHPALFALVEPLRRLAAALLPKKGTVAASLTLGDAGVDVLLEVPKVPGLEALEALARFAAEQDLARLSWRAGHAFAPVAQRRPVRAVFAGVAVDLPADAFLQASSEADEALGALVLDAVDEPRRIADLYAGVGTFSFALARRAPVHAVEGDAEAARALAQSAARANLADRVTVERRDLARRPLSAEELARFDAVVFDPPRTGAAPQSRALAQSTVPRVVAVSCNPATFARDARILADGGYALAHIAPVDSFVWSPHLELVARFERR
ncbi:MAG: class I SAM-dependent RNA methyltransferase [Alphaproteobacteria bacterium]|nr:class I SAM-dependent RNA methyltransferase [Alphaproteobacteria bacterium]